jgi:hypothetical protein
VQVTSPTTPILDSTTSPTRFNAVEPPTTTKTGESPPDISEYPILDPLPASTDDTTASTNSETETAPIPASASSPSTSTGTTAPSGQPANRAPILELAKDVAKSEAKPILELAKDVNKASVVEVKPIADPMDDLHGVEREVYQSEDKFTTADMRNVRMPGSRDVVEPVIVDYERSKTALSVSDNLKIDVAQPMSFRSLKSADGTDILRPAVFIPFLSKGRMMPDDKYPQVLPTTDPNDCITDQEGDAAQLQGSPMEPGIEAQPMNLPDEACEQLHGCGACSSSPFCVWCSSLSLCVTGDSTGAASRLNCFPYAYRDCALLLNP